MEKTKKYYNNLPWWSNKSEIEKFVNIWPSIEKIENWSNKNRDVEDSNFEEWEEE